MTTTYIIAAVLILLLIFVSLPFERSYGKQWTELAHNQAARFLGGVGLLMLANMDPILGGLAFLLLFLWIADIQLLSSVSLS
jgi:hypothetical protein